MRYSRKYLPRCPEWEERRGWRFSNNRKLSLGCWWKTWSCVGSGRNQLGFYPKFRIKQWFLLKNSEGMLKFFTLRKSNYISIFDLKISVIFLFLWQFSCFLPSQALHFWGVISSVAAFGGGFASNYYNLLNSM